MNRKVRIYKQSCVHLWFERRFGRPYSPLTCTDDAPAGFVAPCFAVGVRLEADDAISVVAPFGLEDVFSLTIRPTPDHPIARDWDRIVEKAKARWPEVRVIGP